MLEFALMWTALMAGLLAGALHVFSGPDHLAALAPLSVEARRGAWRVGLRWGLGHSSGVLAAGAAAFLLRGVIHAGSLSSRGERSVGVVLVALGLWGFRRLSRERLHSHTHRHDGRIHTHFHLHARDAGHGASASHVHTHAAFLVGTLHGAAGSSHLLGVLPALALPTWRQTALCLGGFGAGTVAAMALFAGALGRATPRRTERGVLVCRRMLAAASGLSLLVGLGRILLPLAGVAPP